MTEVLLPQSAAVQALAFGIAVGAFLAGGLCWFWSHDRGYARGWAVGHAAGWVKGVNDAGVLDRLLTLEDTAGADVEAGMRRHDAALAEWLRQGKS